MPVSFTVADHPAKPATVRDDQQKANGARWLLEQSWGTPRHPRPSVYQYDEESDSDSGSGGHTTGSRPFEMKNSNYLYSTNPNKVGELYQSTFDSGGDWDFSRIDARRNGFVDTVIEAYAQHHNLIIRPDDVWLAILTQFSFYVNAHAEDLRGHFVSHRTKEHLVVIVDGDRHTVNFGVMAKLMTEKIHEQVVDETLVDWVLPNFSTTTHNDTVAASVILMSTLTEYFTYKFSCICGIPNMTLEGTKDDWENILSRIDKLEQYGEEPEAWAKLLRPILRRFVSAFEGNIDKAFWQSIVHERKSGYMPSIFTGWITAFCVWTEGGRWKPTGKEEATLDGVGFQRITKRDIPVGFCGVPVTVEDSFGTTQCTMVSGHVGSYVEGNERDTVRPLTAWFLFSKS